MSGTNVNSVSDSSIYIGTWTNWSKGSIRGATVTLTNRDGALLTAFLALFVTFVGRSFWRIFCFVAHRTLSTSAAQDGLYHQTQAVLRNADESIAGLKYFVLLAWNWRKKSTRLWLRFIPLIGVATVVTIGFFVASVFSSQISTATADEVLISSPNCGPIDLNHINTTDLYRDLLAYESRLTTASATYAQQCYEDQTGGQECSVFVRKQIPQVVSRNASCPFPGQDKICKRDTMNLRIDSGAINSHDHFGINSAPKDRWSYRNVLECAPLQTQNYENIVGSSGNATVQFLYGDSGIFQNSSVTYNYPMHAPSALKDYYVWTFDYAPEETIHTFTPIPELMRDDAEVTLVFVAANAVKFVEPVDDDLFSAHRVFETQELSLSINKTEELYTFDDVAHVVGCTTQSQFCLGGSETDCTPLTAWEAALQTVSNMTMTDLQKESLNIWRQSQELQGTTLDTTVANLGGSALIAKNSFENGLQGPLPSNQWQLEVEHWQATTMAKMQRSAVEYATGPSDSAMQKHVLEPPNQNAKKLCKSQKVKSASHTSFSVLGLCITLILGGIIITLEITAEPLSRIIYRSTGLYKGLEWVANETLQLQRMTHEELGAGTWTGVTDNIPTTAKSERLATLDITNPAHPRLIYNITEAKNAESEFNTLSTQVTRVDTTGDYHHHSLPDSSRSNYPPGAFDSSGIIEEGGYTTSPKIRASNPREISQPSISSIASHPGHEEPYRACNRSRLSGTPSIGFDEWMSDPHRFSVR